MSSEKKTAHKKNSPEFPALRAFLAAYLHQDFRDEYGSAANAAKTFCADANDAEVSAVRAEWKSWRASIAQSSVNEIAKSLSHLGAAWQPESAKDLDEISNALG
jgi:hypothetical protein